MTVAQGMEAKHQNQSRQMAKEKVEKVAGGVTPMKKASRIR